ncbi:MAG: hypothetical protein ABW096_05915 [Candidatus Thiodiazotropha sp.]
MLLEQYKESHLLFNTNFLENCSRDGIYGYRGELVLVEGEVADAKGHAKPPVEVLRGAALLADEKIKLLLGAIDKLDSFATLLDKYKADFSPEMKALIYVVNLERSVVVEADGIGFILIPLLQGVPWNEVIDELGLEKSDFKGQSAADKILTLYDELKTYKPKYPQIGLDELYGLATDEVREGWGAV